MTSNGVDPGALEAIIMKDLKEDHHSPSFSLILPHSPSLEAYYLFIFFIEILDLDLYINFIFE
jgi:hypothetical protein